ncbi:MAG TPA: hypothetical protein VIK99_06860 [Thermaerobacter sp.]
MRKLRRLVMLTLFTVLAFVLAVRGAGGENRNQGPAGRQLADWMGPGVLDWTTGAPATLTDWMGPGVLDREPGTSAKVAKTTTT